jgi:carboxynorspermidine decarboxylase
MSVIHERGASGESQLSVCGIRVNPEYSEVETMLYNPCAPGTRFGITHRISCRRTLPTDIEGFHCHCHCESGAVMYWNVRWYILRRKFSKWFPQLKWLNLGGGHLITRKDYDMWKNSSV